MPANQITDKERPKNLAIKYSHDIIGIPLPLTAAVMEMMQALKTDGHGDADHCSLVKYYEKMAYVEVRR